MCLIIIHYFIIFYYIIIIYHYFEATVATKSLSAISFDPAFNRNGGVSPKHKVQDVWILENAHFSTLSKIVCHS